MKKKIIIALILIISLLFCGCSTDLESNEDSYDSVIEKNVEANESKNQEISDLTDALELGEIIIDPEYDFDISQMVPSDFGSFFDKNYECETTTYKIAEGTDCENTVTVIKGSEEGSSVYIIAGVHGDEEAAWQTGNLLEKIKIKAGTLTILSPANPWGAQQEIKSRYVKDDYDLNRSFPGKIDGNKAEQAAYYIFEDLKKVSPDFVFDLHEARIVNSSRDFLGSSLIFTDLKDMNAMLMDLIMETQLGNLCSEEYKFYSPGPQGSVNSTISKDLSIPTITVETFRGYPMERRLKDQLDIVQYVLKNLEMVE